MTHTKLQSLVVTTRTASYLIDHDAGTLTRHPASHTPAGYRTAELRRDGDAVPLIAVLECAVGRPLVALIDVRGDGVPTLRRSTEVRAIEAVGGPAG